MNNINITADFTEYKRVFLEENSKRNLISKNDEKFLSRYSTIIWTPFEYEIRNNTFILVIVHVNGGNLGAMDIVFKQSGNVYKTSLITYPNNITISYTNEKVTITPQYTTAVSIVELIK